MHDMIESVESIPKPLPPGTPVYSSGTGWLADGHGGRIRASTGFIVAPLSYERFDIDKWWAPDWTYLVQWDFFHKPVSKVSKTICPIDGLSALAHAATDYVPQCWLCRSPVAHCYPCDLCDTHQLKWEAKELTQEDIMYIHGPARDLLESGLEKRHRPNVNSQSSLG